jgi:DNA-binding beta-propeller fold protein YncE
MKLLVLLLGMALLAAYMPRAVAEPFATGLNQPRGMAFDASGDLFVAEAGAASIDFGNSGRVMRISPRGELSLAVDGLPFTHLPDHGDVGAADLAILGGALYVLTGEGHATLSRSVQPVASLLNFAATGLSSDLIGSGLVASNPYAIAAAPDGSAVCSRRRVGARAASSAGWGNSAIRRVAAYAAADWTGVRPGWKIALRRF